MSKPIEKKDYELRTHDDPACDCGSHIVIRYYEEKIYTNCYACGELLAVD